MNNNCYAIHHLDEVLLIDPAWDFFQIYDFMKVQDLNLRAVLLTHSHFDHINLANMFALKCNVPVYMSEIEINDYKFNCAYLHKAYHLQSIDIGCFNILPIHTPGHTSGSTCFQIGSNLFSGDTVFTEGVGICSQEGGNVEQLYDSIQFIKHTISPETLIWPGHSYGKEPGQNFKYILDNNIYFQFRERKYFVDFRMRKNQPSF